MVWRGGRGRANTSRRTLAGVDDAFLLAALFFGTAILYSSVGHAGASGYLAGMALVGLPQAVMKPTALVLNILVASVVTVRFHRDETGNVVALGYSNPVLRDVRFTRLNDRTSPR